MASSFNCSIAFEKVLLNLPNEVFLSEKPCFLALTSFFCHSSPLRALLGGFNKSYKEAGRTKWMNSPNVYQKVEVLETGTPDPKKITKVEVAVIEDRK